jgi:hypothetical protein
VSSTERNSSRIKLFGSLKEVTFMRRSLRALSNREVTVYQ